MQHCLCLSALLLLGKLPPPDLWGNLTNDIPLLLTPNPKSLLLTPNPWCGTRTVNRKRNDLHLLVRNAWVFFCHEGDTSKNGAYGVVKLHYQPAVCWRLRYQSIYGKASDSHRRQIRALVLNCPGCRHLCLMVELSEMPPLQLARQMILWIRPVTVPEMPRISQVCEVTIAYPKCNE